MEGKKLRGVYSTESSATAAKGVAGIGGTTRRLWVVWDYDEDNMLAQPLNQNLIPSGERRTITLTDFLGSYRKEPDYVIDQSAPEFSSVWKAPKEEPVAMPPASEPAAKRQELAYDDGTLDLDDSPDTETTFAQESVPDDEPVELTEPLTPEEPRQQAQGPEAPIKEVIANMEADFADGLKHLKAGEIEEAVELFEYLADMKADFAPEHKHMFNGFGIDLRKNKIFDLAIKHYTKALDLSPADENLYHNLARVHYEKGDLDLALKNLEKSLEINPKLKESEMFWDYIIRKRRKMAKKKYSMDI